MAEVLTKLKANVNGEVVDAQICYQNCVTNKPTFKTINGEEITGEGNIITAAGSSGVPIDSIYPVGSIYMSVVNNSPANFIGGTWEQLKDRFLLAAGNSYANGATGGSATHTLTVNEMPSHTHTQNAHTHTQNAHSHTMNSHDHGIKYKLRNGKAGIGNDYGTDSSGTNIAIGGGNSTYWCGDASGVTTVKDYIDIATATSTMNSTTATNQSTTATNQNTGGGQAHNNMPPYLAVYMWKRTA